MKDRITRVNVLKHIDLYAQELLNRGAAYYCDCPPEELEKQREEAKAKGDKPRYNGRCRERSLKAGPNTALRFRSPLEGVTHWHDLTKGAIAFDNTELDDLVIVRADGVPTYNFAVVVDDITMAITHVIRGDDHIPNTPRQILIYEALGAQLPQFAHIPMILGTGPGQALQTPRRPFGPGLPCYGLSAGGHGEFSGPVGLVPR